jgi:hypothetical protein
MTDALTDLGTTDLIKLVNDEYAAVLASDRATYPRAIRIGEALKVLTGRINHGDKKAWFKEHCPKLSYETARVYIRLAENQEEIITAAKAKSVETTLTIASAMGLLRKPKTTTPVKPKAKRAQAGGVEPGDTRTNAASTAPDAILSALDARDIFDILKADNDKLQELYNLLRDHVTKSSLRRPLTQPQASA